MRRERTRRFDKAEPADVACLAGPRREDDMDWQKPSFEEINMSAEIGAYQGDDDGRDASPPSPRPPPTARRRAEARSPGAAPASSGSAAGGGFPQWNCGCPNCRERRARAIRAAAAHAGVASP